MGGFRRPSHAMGVFWGGGNGPPEMGCSLGTMRCKHFMRKVRI